MKKTRITPILKKGKPVDEIDSYRPINNLPCVEKIVEEHLKRQMEEFIRENKIMNKDHHGGRKNHSTITAKVTIEHEATKAHEEGKSVAIYSTDLSAAYDTVKIPILISKLKHYGFRGQSKNILESYLYDREQYVEIEVKTSEVKEYLEVSVIQGSKLSGLLYNLYSNEVLLVHKLMHDPKQVDITEEQ